MNNAEFEALMRQGEQFRSRLLPVDQWLVVRADGHGFSRLTETHFQKPFDPRFHHCMVRAAQALLEEFGGLYAYTQSDEISLLLPKNWAMFDRRHEKTVSISAGIASAVFTQAAVQAARFDSRVWMSSDTARVMDYFRWRQSDGGRCALNGWCYWTLRRQGQSYAQATAALEGQTSDFKRALLLQHGTDFDQVPRWQQHGVGLYPESFEKAGYNPVKNETVTAVRRRVKVDSNLPVGDEYARFIGGFLGE